MTSQKTLLLKAKFVVICTFETLVTSEVLQTLIKYMFGLGRESPLRTLCCDEAHLIFEWLDFREKIAGIPSLLAFDVLRTCSFAFFSGTLTVEQQATLIRVFNLNERAEKRQHSSHTTPYISRGVLTPTHVSISAPPFFTKGKNAKDKAMYEAIVVLEYLNSTYFTDGLRNDERRHAIIYHNTITDSDAFKDASTLLQKSDMEKDIAKTFITFSVYGTCGGDLKDIKLQKLKKASTDGKVIQCTATSCLSHGANTSTALIIHIGMVSSMHILAQQDLRADRSKEGGANCVWLVSQDDFDKAKFILDHDKSSAAIPDQRDIGAVNAYEKDQNAVNAKISNLRRLYAYWRDTKTCRCLMREQFFNPNTPFLGCSTNESYQTGFTAMCDNCLGGHVNKFDSIDIHTVNAVLTECFEADGRKPILLKGVLESFTKKIQARNVETDKIITLSDQYIEDFVRVLIHLGIIIEALTFDGDGYAKDINKAQDGKSVPKKKTKKYWIYCYSLGTLHYKNIDFQVRKRLVTTLPSSSDMVIDERKDDTENTQMS